MKVMELRRLNETEIDTILVALELLADDKRKGWSARAMLEDNAAFVNGLFWTSKISPTK